MKRRSAPSMWITWQWSIIRQIEIVPNCSRTCLGLQIGGEERREPGHGAIVKQPRVLLDDPRGEVTLAKVLEGQEGNDKQLEADDDDPTTSSAWLP